jgi:poly(hydroxyalkanoate) depolymerase family esterase
MNDTLQGMMREAKRLTQTGHLTEATALIQRALSGSKALTAAAQQSAATASTVLNGIVLNRRVDGTPLNAEINAAGDFISGSHTHAGLTRDYKLYVPPKRAGRALPLVVMLHGCTQDPGDFAAGTGMNARAQTQGFFVLYPAQSQDGNAQRCWNWFARAHQQRGSGEPALLADMTQSVINAYGIDAQRVYVAGLSAGGAMADIVGAAYPEIYAALGIHSGLPRGAATNVAGAFAAMKNGEPATRSTAKIADAAVPTIVFHGDADQTVHPKNGEQVIAALLRRVASNEPTVEQGVASGGRSYTRSTYRAETGETVAEHWVAKGAGHAWSGGSAKGSYTDAKGPDATGEMLRFFFEHPLRDRPR